MPAFELIVGQVTAPDTTLTALTMATGNSLTVRNTDVDANIRLIQAWGDNQTAGILRLRSPRLHDNVQGIRVRVAASEVYPLLPWRPQQRLYSQDTLVAELSGSATAGDIEGAALLLWYENLPGIDQRLITFEDLLQRMTNLVTVENSLSTGTSGGWSGEEAINAEFDLLRANTDYALIGYLASAECLAIRWRGVDTGNLGIGGPGNDVARDITANWFSLISQMTGLASIPVFNSSNKAGILIDAAQDENGTDVIVTSILAQLGG